ncbi:MAG: zinc ribbon domain-containing protein [Armatimonadetes bacterium]|nr:zinc ribbon domain-containing protein [Armatimonadota bacterium]
MPVYEYRCEACGKKFQTLVGVTQDGAAVDCPACQSPLVTKLVSRFIRGRNEDARIDEMADRFENMTQPESYVEMRESMKEMGRAMDEDFSDEMEEALETDLAEGVQD